MNNSTRRTRFEARVSLERDFLTRVNSAFGRTEPLAGMTTDAIDSWRQRAKIIWPTADINRIASLLLEASARADLLADNSKEVFEPEHRPPADSLDELRGLLDRALGEEIAKQARAAKSNREVAPARSIGTNFP